MNGITGFALNNSRTVIMSMLLLVVGGIMLLVNRMKRGDKLVGQTTAFDRFFLWVVVAVIGTGSSGIQAIPVLAEQAAHLTVFQRTPNYPLPSQNVPMSAEYEQDWKQQYADRRAEMRYTAHGSLKELNDEPALSVDPERRARFERDWMPRR